jgi:hypothetical protein
MLAQIVQLNKIYTYVDTPTGMSYIKIIDANQARIHRYNNLRRKLCNCNGW